MENKAIDELVEKNKKFKFDNLVGVSVGLITVGFVSYFILFAIENGPQYWEHLSI